MTLPPLTQELKSSKSSKVFAKAEPASSGRSSLTNFAGLQSPKSQRRPTCNDPRESRTAPQQVEGRHHLSVSILSMAKEDEIASAQRVEHEVLESQVFSLASCLKAQLHEARSPGLLEPPDARSEHHLQSVASARSKHSLSDEGFSKQKEEESENMWKVMQTLLNRSTVSKKHQKTKSTESAMEIIEEEVELEGQCTDFKRNPSQRPSVLQSLQKLPARNPSFRAESGNFTEAACAFNEGELALRC